MLPPQVLGRQAQAGLAFRSLHPLDRGAPHAVGRQHGAKRAEAGAAAHIAGQAVAKTHTISTCVVKKAAAQKQVAGGAHRCHRAGVAHQRAVLIVEVDAMRVHRALAHQAKVVIHRQVTARRREQGTHPADFIAVFCHVRLDPDIWILRGQLARAAQLLRGAGGRKPGRDGVAQAVHAVPAPDEVFGVDQALLGLVAHAVGRVAVLQHLAGDEPHLPALCFGKQRVDRGRVRGGKRERRGHPVAQQLIHKKGGHLRAVVLGHKT